VFVFLRFRVLQVFLNTMQEPKTRSSIKEGSTTMTDQSRNEIDKREMDLQLTRELEETFPASDPLTITRSPRKRDTPEKELKGRQSLKVGGKNDAERIASPKTPVSPGIGGMQSTKYKPRIGATIV
jgi:hypothetical protein